MKERREEPDVEGESPSNTCRVCHRPLRNPVSVKHGIGPVCRGGRGKKQKQMDLPFGEGHA